MKKIIELLTQNYSRQPPFIKENEDGSYSLVGNSDLANGDFTDFGEFGKHRLTAKNHSKTLLKLMNFLTLIDAMDEGGLDFDEQENKMYLESFLGEVLSSYFMFEVEYTEELFIAFIEANKQLVNECLYNLTKDKEAVKEINYQDVAFGLDGTQFADPYVSIAYEIAKEFKKRPSEIINEWSTSELIVLFAKLANDRSQESFLTWTYNQPNAPKRKAPRKQQFYFEDVGVGDNE